MNKYKIETFSCRRKGEEPLVLLEFERERFTYREYKDLLLSTLFDLAGTSYEYKHIGARVFCNDNKVLTMYCDTTVDGSTITAHIKAARPREKFCHIRDMIIAC